MKWGQRRARHRAALLRGHTALRETNGGEVYAKRVRVMLLCWIYRGRQYFSADVLLTNVLCDNNHDRGNKRQFLYMAPLWFQCAQLLLNLHFKTLFLLFPTAEMY